MAFKPLDVLRKRSKYIMAFVTLVAIFVFIIGDSLDMRRGGGGANPQAGAGIARWLGTTESVAKVYGTPWDEQQLAELAARRVAAQDFLMAVTGLGEAKFDRSLGLTDADMADMNKRHQKREEVFAKNTGARDQQFLSFSALCRQAYPNLRFLPYLRMSSGIDMARLYGVTPHELLDHLMYKRKADELGIVVTPALVIEDLKTAGLGQLTDRELSDLARTRGIGRVFEDLVAQIADDIRALIARSVLHYGASGAMAGGGGFQLTPHDLWEAYVKVQTQLQVAIRPIDVAQDVYLNKVPEPTPQQLREYYTKYKDETPDPARDTPGFKIPPLYRVAFIYGNLRETQEARKFYAKWAAAIQEMDPYAHLTAILAMYEARKATAYRIAQPFFDLPVGAKAADAAYLRVGPATAVTPDRQTAAAFAAGFAAALAQGAAGVPVAAPLVGVRGAPLAKPQADALAVASLAGHAAGGLPGLLAYPFPPRSGSADRFQPLAEVWGGLLDERTEEMCRNLLSADLVKLEKEIKEYQAKYSREYSSWRMRGRSTGAKFVPPLVNDKESLDDYLKRFCTTRGLTYVVTAEPRSRFELLTEPKERPLNTLLKPLYVTGASTMDDKQLRDAVTTDLLDNRRTFEPRQTAPPFGGKQWEYALHWKVEETDARVPPLAECVAAVKTAWRFEQARTFAEEDARRLATEARALPDGLKLLVDGKGFRDNEILARFRQAPTATSTVLTFEPAPIPPVLDYAPDDLLDQVLVALKKPGDVVVISNKPKTQYFVIYLKDRREPRADDPRALQLFDFQVIMPSASQQMQVSTGGGPQSFAQFAARDKIDRYRKQWQVHTEAVTGLTPEGAKKLEDIVKSYTKGG